MVKTYFPRSLSASRYDSFLASGWFRGSIMLYKMDLLCIDESVSSIVNIRLNMLSHKSRKSHAKLKRQNERRYTTVISRAKLDNAREALYEKNKAKFKGFIHHNLEDYLHSGFFSSVFNTFEVAVYDHERLVAVSFFDVGNASIASLIGLYDPEYSNHSLGIYTMLKEIEWGLRSGKKWYYPGYILDNDPSFNYKLSLGDFEYYNSNQRWSNFKHFDQSETIAFQFNHGMQEIEDALNTHGISYKKLLYPYFSLGYLPQWNHVYMKQPAFFLLSSNIDTLRIATYDVGHKKYLVLDVDRDPYIDRFMNMEISQDLVSEHVYSKELLLYKTLIKDAESAIGLLR